jgi:aminoglycoside phosphotransferase (APT) family kinase protein
MSMFEGTLRKDPGADLQPIFELYARSYAQRRNKVIANVPRPMVVEAPVSTSPPGVAFSSTFRIDKSKPHLSPNQKRLLQQLKDTSFSGGSKLHSEVVNLFHLEPELESVLPPHVCEHISRHLLDADVLFSQSPGGRFVLRLSSIVVKIGRDLEHAEPDILRLIEERVPTIPVPKGFGALKSDNISMMFYSSIDGDPLSSVWALLSEAEKLQIQQQLQAIFFALRGIAFPSAPATLGFAGKVKDCRRHIREATDLSSEEEFNDFLLGPLLPRISSQYRDCIRSKMKDDHRIVFTHGDLHPRNIMVARDTEAETVTITGLLDWELGGWYPEYWEYVKALNTFSTLDGDALADWWRYLPPVITGYDAEWALDHVLEGVIVV